MRAWRWVAVSAVAVLLVGLVGVAGFALGHSAADSERVGPGMMGRYYGPTTGGRYYGPMMGRGAGPAAFDEEDFLVEMVAHHQEAVAAARQLSRSDRPQLRAFGRRIVAVQSQQITQMQGWLDRWYGGGGQADYVPMMRDLSGLSGGRLDRTFLVDMIAHHRMAVMMEQMALVHGDLHPAVATLARDIRDGQTAEIRVMYRWLEQWFPGYAGYHMPMMGAGWRR